MKLEQITFTGIDESTQISRLADICQQYPFVEFGVLVSRSSAGKRPRYPSLEWIDDLVQDMPRINLSCHICGSLSYNTLKGKSDVLDFLGHRLEKFGRAQLNFGARLEKVAFPGFVEVIRQFATDEIILQIYGRNLEIALAVCAEGMPVAGLVDESSGRGVVPGSWSLPTMSFKCGFAGGLGPDNIVAEAERIASILPENYGTWLDMETKVRSEDDTKFELDKVLECIDQLMGHCFIGEICRDSE